MSKELCNSQQCIVSNECAALRSARKINECFRDQEEIKTQIIFNIVKANARGCPNVGELIAKIEPEIKDQEIPQEKLPL